jgi:hypothetical protein
LGGYDLRISYEPKQNIPSSRLYRENRHLAPPFSVSSHADTWSEDFAITTTQGHLHFHPYGLNSGTNEPPSMYPSFAGNSVTQIDMRRLKATGVPFSSFV